MSEESPNSLKPPKVTTEKMKKWPLYVTFLAVLSLFGVLFYSVNYGTGSRKESGKKAGGGLAGKTAGHAGGPRAVAAATCQHSGGDRGSRVG